MRCPQCGYEQILAFSRKKRGVCPSCEARRMVDMAAHLVDRVLPPVPYRQWVLSVAYPHTTQASTRSGARVDRPAHLCPPGLCLAMSHRT
ncbi:MAG: transposase zinc-binding domain-containing protein [Deltaproteobacteria bacterium]|nr:transposase zinc-binding domain-containing protein [Deltaproteobacteria bacterium]